MSSHGIFGIRSSLLVPVLLACASAPVVTTMSNSACGGRGAEGAVPFVASEAQPALLEAAMTAADCSERAAAATGKVTVHFSPAGCVLNVTLEVEGPELTADDTDCIAKNFLAARVKPYSGAPVAVSRALKPTR